MVSAQRVELLVGRQRLAVVLEQEVHVAELAVDLGVDVAGLDWVSSVVVVILKKKNCFCQIILFNYSYSRNLFFPKSIFKTKLLFWMLKHFLMMTLTGNLICRLYFYER